MRESKRLIDGDKFLDYVVNIKIWTNWDEAIDMQNVIKSGAFDIDQASIISQQKESIERVMAELEHEVSLYRPSDFEEEKDDGVILAYNHAIRSLK